jgi:hypothetical protein
MDSHMGGSTQGIANTSMERDFENARSFQHNCPLLTCSGGVSVVASGQGRPLCKKSSLYLDFLMFS